MKIRVSDLLYCRPLIAEMSATLKINLLHVCQRATFDSTDLTRRIDLLLTNDSGDGICFSYFRGILQHFFLEQFIYPPIHSSECSFILNCIQPSTLRGRSGLSLPLFLFASLTDLDPQIFFSFFFLSTPPVILSRQ